MPIKLYYQSFSPVARSVAAICDIFDVPVEIVNMNLLNGEHYKPEFLKLNPCHTIPVFVDGDLVIHDSHAIIMYVSEVYGNDSPLYPKDVKQRALINNKLLFHSSTLFTRAKSVTAGTFVDKQKGATPKQVKDLEEAAGFLEEFLSRTKFVAMDRITVADIICYATVLSYPLVISLNSDKYPKINAWLKEMKQQPYSQKHIEEGAKVLEHALRAAQE